METDISAARVKDAKLERFPEVHLKGSVEKASNIPVYENGLFSKPTQHEVIHTLYRAGTDFYFNIYNGNKLNIKIKQEEILQKIKEIQKRREHFRYSLQSSFIVSGSSEEFDVPKAYKRGYSGSEAAAERNTVSL